MSGMRFVEAVCGNPRVRVFRVVDGGGDPSEWWLEPVETPVLADDGGGAGLFVIAGLHVREDGRVVDCYMDVHLPERVNDLAYFIDGGRLRHGPAYAFGGEIIPAVAIAWPGVYELFYSRRAPKVGIEVLRRGIAVARRKGSIAEDLGYIYRNEGRYAEAAEMFQVAVGEGPSSHFIYGELASAYGMIGERERERNYRALYEAGDLGRVATERRMKARMTWVLSTALVVLLVAAAGVVVVLRVYGIGALVPGLSREAMYPAAQGMPAVVAGSVEELIGEYEAFLKAEAPGVVAALQAGLGDGEIDELERKHGVKLTGDLRALYRWRNGTAAGVGVDAFPEHRFVPLGEALAARDAARQGAGQGGFVERQAYAVLAGHREGWVGVIVDAAGDGYFFDPGRRESEGSFFFCFAEDGSYEFFPAFRNYLAGVVEGGKAGVFGGGVRGVETRDFGKAREVMGRYGGRPRG